MISHQLLKGLYRIQTTTWIIVGIMGVIGAIALAWLCQIPIVINWFTLLHPLQDNPPLWLQTPPVSNKYYLLLPTIALSLISLLVIKLSPKPQTWSRIIIVSILLALTIRYLLWRLFSTLVLDNPVNGIFSLALFFLEFLGLTTSLIELYFTLRVKYRKDEADKYSVAVEQGIYLPSVDILIPTYNEPNFILRRTIIGCQALDYPNKKIYLLDDSRRKDVRELAEYLSCNYLTRTNNNYAKAGNLNHAIAQTSGELIAVFDADFVPTKNFLTRTVGFFQKQKIGLVQTPQNFYNADPIARNLGLERILPPDEEIFYRNIQTIKDAAGAVVCAGTSFVVRRKALKEIGYFVTDSICEDYFTGICLSAAGYELIYLNEKLSAGLAAESVSAFVEQRLRWCRGTLQGLFIKANPLMIKGLSLRQKIAHLCNFMSWFTSISRFAFVLMPIGYSFFHIEAIRTSIPEILYLFLPFYITQLIVFSWLNGKSRSFFMSEIYSLLQCVPLTFTVIHSIFKPFAKQFKVTPKGTVRSGYYFNYYLALPIIILLVLTIISLGINWEMVKNFAGQKATLTFVWSIYNSVILTVTLFCFLDVPNNSNYESFPLRRRVLLDRYRGELIELSELGAVIEVGDEVNLDIGLETKTIDSVIIPEELKLRAKVIDRDLSGKFTKVKVTFTDLSLTQHRKLVEMLFCRPNQWKEREAPGELRSLFLLGQVLLRNRLNCFKIL